MQLYLFVEAILQSIWVETRTVFKKRRDTILLWRSTKQLMKSINKIKQAPWLDCN